MYEVSQSIKDQLKSVPQKPGIYLMKDKFDKIIYVGKAKKLKNRLSSYFRAVESHPTKTKTLVVNTETFEYIIVKSEEEALLLEANFIKKYRPKFNVMLKDDKSYPSIVITKEKYPRVFKSRQFTKNQEIFGPYTKALQVNMALEGIHRLFPIRKCNTDLSKIVRPCLYYHMNECIAPCVFDVEKEYNSYIDKIRDLLKRKSTEVYDLMNQKKEKFVKELNFEEAIIIRDEIEAIKTLEVFQKVSREFGKDRDFIGYFIKKDQISFYLLIYRSGKLISTENYVLEIPIDEEVKDILKQFIFQYYTQPQGVPPEIFIDEDLDETLENYLRNLSGRKVVINNPQRGENKVILETATENAKEYIDKFTKKIEEDRKRQEEIRISLETITLRDQVSRIEAYDISNILGMMSVGSMVVYDNFKKKPSDYRKFKIKTVEGPNDVASLREVVERRLLKLKDSRFGVKPDIMLIDGGKPQLRAVKEVVDKFGYDIAVIAMVKDDHHKTRGLIYEDEYYELDRGTVFYRFIYSIQEEVHRFAISYHQKLRGKSMLSSVFDEIPGIGKVKREALIKRFDNITNIKRASIEELTKVKGINEALAIKIKEYLNRKD